MKKTRSLLSLLTLIVIAAPAARAQSTKLFSGFFGSVTSYLTAFNPELEGVLDSHHGMFWSGAQWQSGAHISSSIGLSYEVYNHFGVESETRFADVSGLVENQQFGVGYSVNVHDVKLTGYLRGVYEFNDDGMTKDRMTAAMGIRALKLLTTHTATFVDFQIPIERAARPVFSVGIAILF